MVSSTPTGLPNGQTAGGFSFAAKSEKTPELIIAVGGDYEQPDSGTSTASVCTWKDDGYSSNYHCEAAQTPPHGYRSSVAYDADLKLWITVGPNGTDVSSDDGRNWRAVHPSAALHESADADRNWNALSLPFVVGPKGRIGKLDPAALTAPPNN